MRERLVAFFLLSSAIITYGQTGEGWELYREKTNGFIQSEERKILAYATINNIPIVRRDADGNLWVIAGISDSGQPLYETTHNAGAATTVGVPKLRTGGGLGLNLEGEGMEIGVWDGGIVGNHIEFGSRILLREGSAEDNHATHVTGTILAAGINAAAKGMAPKAKVYAYDFANDLPEMIAMARPDQSGLILSNHSYGLVTGWRFNNGWQWFGDAAISSFEDWKFGFYSSGARQWDDLSFNAPYYLIVKSAGNDRTDTGNGAFPADCNGGSGYDCISDKAVAKNILTVGAVTKVENYVSPSSVVMSSFSSWGPTDDGRIKPDLVAAGVNLFSTYTSPTNDLYGTLSGTSMATPSVTGALALLQELHKNLTGGNYMRSSTLKALAIHTTKEAGPNPGPDYQHGWGLLDVEAAAKILLERDNQNVFIIEDVLANNQIKSFRLSPKVNTKIKATLVWTDPAGTPVGASLDPTNLMLVNDLDVRLRDDAGVFQYPWILNPNQVDAPAEKGDNIRDNVEKLEFTNLEPREYDLRISHKGSLAGGNQRFSIIIQYESTSDTQIPLYWVGGTGNWNNPANWSFTSGGGSANLVPNLANKVVVDENSFVSPNGNLNFSTDAICGSFVWLVKNSSGISLNGNTLRIAKSISLPTAGFVSHTTGTMSFEGGAGESQLFLGQNDLNTLKLNFNSAASVWSVKGSSQVAGIEVMNGFVTMEDNDLRTSRLLLKGPSTSRILNLKNSTLRDLLEVDLSGEISLIETSGAKIFTTESANLNFGSIDFNGSITLADRSDLYSSGLINEIKVLKEVRIYDGLSVSKLDLAAGSSMMIEAGTEVSSTSATLINSTALQRVSLSTLGAGNATLKIDGHFKLCFDFLNVTNVNLSGSAIINAGSNSQLLNSTGWVQDLCDNVLFPDFETAFPCKNGYTQFTDKSTGSIQSRSWTFGNLGNSNKTNPNFTFSETGDIDVTLSVSNALNNQSYSKRISIQDNSLLENEIILSGNFLFSVKSAPTYKWYNNDNLIPNSNSRSYLHNGQPGLYFVVTQDEICNRISDFFVITSTEVVDSDFSFFPNPADKFLAISMGDDGLVSVYSTFGKLIYQNMILKGEQQIELADWPAGIYFININYGNRVKQFKFLKL
ncbi:MAG: S8 family serine peptidase [Cytophagales bacterium]|nr:S8 family serine peptidase [Cytophagales bacterium]